jgi:phosphoribosylglycinamide formyltransferase-1
VAVLASGNGSNLQALIDACAAPEFPARIAVVVCNVPDAFALERARRAGITAVCVPHKGRTREEFEVALLEAVRGCDWVCLAGFMRVLTGRFLDALPGRVLNVHPALLPAFPGAHGIRDARAHGVTVTGATVHLVDAGVDTGPILAQGVAPVLDSDDDESLATRVRALEHRLYPMALRWAVEGRVRVQGRRAFVELREGEARALFA